MRNILKTGVALLVLCHVPMGSLANDNNATPSPDFDGDGTVGFPDFLLFGDVFGSSQGDEGYKARFDLDGDGTIGFSDFLIFVDSFGGIFIPDANLRAAIAAALGKAGGASITVAEMKTLNRLHAPEAGINDLTGLESATNLERLSLGFNEITDVSALAGLTNLTFLNFRNNEITDISALAGLTNLERLFFANNNITDVSPLAGLTNLTFLNFLNNEITDVSPLASLTNLKDLGLGFNNITDVSALAGLTNLTFLDFRNNEITDVSPLAGLTNLTFLSLGSDVSLTDISALAGLTNLTYLNLWGHDITDISALAGLTNLTFLNLWGNDITDISALAGLTNLTYLDLWGNNITDISMLGGLTSLTELRLNDNNITDISMLGGLTSLTELRLNDNNITDISMLGGLTNLERLFLANNNITDMSALAGLTNLIELFLRFNAITDITALAGLTNLIKLDLRGNPLNDSSINDHIPTLQRIGVEVFFDPSRPKGDFDIELVFPDHFSESQKNVLQYAARRWMAVISEDLPDYELAEGWSGTCGEQSYEIPAGERIDDLRIYITTIEGGRGQTVGWGGPRLLREETYLPVLGCMAFDLKRANLLITGLHEIGHVLGAGKLWRDLGFLQDLDGDTHFNGPLAIAAFNDAGGRDYTGKKVPVRGTAHWRRPVLSGELMVSGGGAALSAITVQSMADLGYGVDVTQADPYTLPGTSAGKASAKIAVATPAIPRVDVTQTDTYIQCGAGLRREPIYVVDPQGRVIRTIRD